jgi:RimJ/RimL family protein N-acetyltransferase
MHVVAGPDLATFAESALPWLARDPVRNNVLWTLVSGRLDGLTPVEPDGYWARVLDDDGEIVGVCLRTPPRSLLLSTMPLPAVEVLAGHLARTHHDLPGVDGPRASSGAFAARFGELLGLRVDDGLSATMYQLDKVEPPQGISGEVREAGPADRDLLVAWYDAFGREALPYHPPEDSGPVVDSGLARGGGIWLWWDRGEPVSVLAISRPAAGVRRIGPVYTPPERRGHGYASASVAAVCERALSDGALACMLYADRANPTSNRIYQRIGFHPVGDSLELVFSRAGG